MNTTQHILLISYTFPPYPGIGGRRWAKFAKYLTRNGYIVHVIHAKNYFNENSLWCEDVQNNPKIKTYELAAKYPKVLLSQPKTIFEKISYKVALLTVKLFSKGTPYDRGIFWENSMMELAADIISKYNIKNVIVSCAPFSCAYYTLALKKIFPELNLIVDLRDPWTWGIGYGFSSLPKKRLLFEKQQEENVMKNADYVLVPAEEMKKYLQENYIKYSKKIVRLPHAFDTDEVIIIPKEKNKQTKLLFYGTLYNGLNEVFESISSSLKKNLNVQLDIYSENEKYKAYFEKNNLLGYYVNYYKSLSPKKLFEKIQSYDFVLIIQPDFAKDYITTKIYEIIYSKTPIILISNEGKLSQFIVENNLGIWIPAKDVSEKFHTITEANKKTFDLEQFPIQNYSFENITKKLTELFI